MKIDKINNTVMVELRNSNQNPKIINSIKFFDRFNVDLYNKIKKLHDEFSPGQNTLILHKKR